MSLSPEPGSPHMYNKPVSSGGRSTCIHCGVAKIRRPPDPNAKSPRTIREGCKVNGLHVWATEAVSHGWSAGEVS